MRSFVLLLWLFALTACTDKREGCLDIEATNFDASADKNCCCTYPKLIFKVAPLFGTATWKPDTAYEYSAGKWFRLKQIVYYLSDFQLIKNGEVFTLSDTSTFSVWGSAGDTTSKILTNDFLLIRRTAETYPAGTFRTAGDFESVRFRVGIPPAAQEVIPDLAPGNHPLRLQPEGLWMGRDTGFAAMKLIFTRDTATTTVPDTLWIGRPDFDHLTVQGDGLFRHQSGYDFVLKLSADYRELFQGVDLSGGDITSWKSQIVSNLPDALRVSQ